MDLEMQVSVSNKLAGRRQDLFDRRPRSITQDLIPYAGITYMSAEDPAGAFAFNESGLVSVSEVVAVVSITDEWPMEGRFASRVGVYGFSVVDGVLMLGGHGRTFCRRYLGDRESMREWFKDLGGLEAALDIEAAKSAIRGSYVLEMMAQGQPGKTRREILEKTKTIRDRLQANVPVLPSLWLGLTEEEADQVCSQLPEEFLTRCVASWIKTSGEEGLPFAGRCPSGRTYEVMLKKCNNDEAETIARLRVDLGDEYFAQAAVSYLAAVGRRHGKFVCLPDWIVQASEQKVGVPLLDVNKLVGMDRVQVHRKLIPGSSQTNYTHSLEWIPERACVAVWKLDGAPNADNLQGEVDGVRFDFSSLVEKKKAKRRKEAREEVVPVILQMAEESEDPRAA